MNDNLQNVYDKLFDYRKVGQLKQQQTRYQDFYTISNEINDDDVYHSITTSSSSSASNYSSNYTNNNLSGLAPGNFSSVRTKISKRSTVNRSKSLVLNKNNRNTNFMKQNYIEFNHLSQNDSNNPIVVSLQDPNFDKPKIHPRKIYLTYEQSNQLNYSHHSNISQELNENKLNYMCEIYQDMPETVVNSNPCIGNTNRSSSKNQFKSFINRKILNKSDIQTDNSSQQLDDSRISVFRSKILTDIINPLKKSISSASSKSSSFSSSLSCSSSSSTPSSPMNLSRKFKINNDLNNGSKEYESIYDDEIEKKTLSKGKVVDELIQTEMDFYRSMKLLFDVYMGPNSDISISTDVKDAIFCNIKEIVELSSSMLNDFELNILNQNPEQIRIGKCFLKNCENIRVIYSHYAQYIEYSNSVLEKNEKSPEVQRFIENGLNIIKQQVNTLDLQSLLLKPIQRVLKYPLLLQELIKNTDSYHEDYQDLLEALKSMQNVATYINEIKRRHELIVKYGRKIKENCTIGNKMSKLTMHSMIKKSNRISVKLSNVLKINTVTTVDEKFDELESKFRAIEKIIKSFIKDSVQIIANLKEFLKTQMANSESLQEFFGDDKLEEIVHYVQINSHFLNDLVNKRTSLIHEKAIKPLKALLDLLDIPNKLIIKRNDKLLDYEFAKLNIEKSKDKLSYKTNQENLNESKRNFEALNNQLIEELPQLLHKCTFVFEKCFRIFVLTQKNIYETINYDIQNLINKYNNGNVFLNEKSSSYTSLTTQLNNRVDIFVNNNNSIQSFANTNLSNKNFDYSDLNKNQSFSNTTGLDIMQRFFSTKPEPTKRIKSIFNLQIFKNLTSQDKQEAPRVTTRQSKPVEYNNSYDIVQTDEIRDRLKRVYSNNLYIAEEKFSGFGLSDNLNLEINDLVYVLKHSDPCGNSDSWFVDNGISKGIVPANILKPYNNNNNRKQSVHLIDFNAYEGEETNYNQPELDDTFTEPKELVIDQNQVYNYENNSNCNDDADSFTSQDDPKIEYCVALYPFEALNDSTLSMSEGERFKVIEKHDTTMNSEWWLVEKLDEYNPGVQGYVPANYVELIKM